MAEPGIAVKGPAPRRRFSPRRILPLLLLLAGAVWYFRDAPREVTLAMDLAGRRDGLQALRIEVLKLPERELALHRELFYSPSSPPPTHLRSAVRLPPGQYEAVLVFDFGERTERLERKLAFEGEDEIVLAP